MKRKTPGGIWALRGITIAITLIVLLVVGSVVYSAYEDYNGVKSELGGANHLATFPTGTSEVISINFTIPNMGLYPLNVTVTCNPQNSNVVCDPSNVVVGPGGQGVLHFKMTIVNVVQFETSNNHHINGTVIISMQPFVSLSVGTDFGGFVNAGGA